MKIWIYVDEYYPFRGLAEGPGYRNEELEVDDKEGRWIKRAMKNFEKAQKRLKELSKYE